MDSGFSFDNNHQNGLFSQAQPQEIMSFFSLDSNSNGQQTQQIQVQGQQLQPMEVQQQAQIGPVLLGPGAKADQKVYRLPRLTYSQKDAVERAKKYAMEQSIKSVLLKQTITHQQQKMQNMQVSAQRQQAVALMCRLYVGTINFEVREEVVRLAFSAFGVIKSISMPYDNVLKRHKGFAFIEYEVPEAASIALDQMNGITLGGFTIKVNHVGRPSNMPQAQPIIEKIIEESKSYNRIYVASIHQDLTESDIRSVFEAFGQIIYCKIALDPAKPGKHKGYAYIEYSSPQSSIDAIVGMNMFDLGGQHLRVGKAVTPPNVLSLPCTQSSLPTASAIAAAAVTARITALEAVKQPIQQNQVIEVQTVTVPILPPIVTLHPPTVLPQPVLMQSIPNIISSFNNNTPPVAVVTQISIQPLSSPFSQNNTDSNVGGFSKNPTNNVPPPMVFIPPTSLATNQNKINNTSFTNQPDVMRELPEIQTLQQQEDMQIKGHQARHMVMQKLLRKKETRVMVLKNMVGVEDVDEELEHEVTDECSKYGVVERVVIYQEKQGEEIYDPVVVKIFVEFTNDKEMSQAINALNGRFFAGRTVVAQEYDQELFDDNDLAA